MKKSDTEKSAGAKLEAPVQLTPEQLETVAAGTKSQISTVKGTTTTGEHAPITLPKLS